MSLFGVMDIAARSMLVVQRGVQTTSHNVANASTPGYTRQRQVLASALAIREASGMLGTGAEQLSIQRVTDQFVARQILAETSSGRALLAQSETLAAVEEVVNEQLEDGVSAALASFYSALEQLTTPTAAGGALERGEVIGASERLADALHRTDAQLRDLQKGADRAIAGTVSRINALAEQIGALNRQIVSQETTAPANDLRDQRDLALREMAGLVDLQSFETDKGSIVVMLSGGGTLVEGRNVTRLTTTGDPANPFDPSFSRVLIDGPAPFDVTSGIAGGDLGGLLRVRDTVLPAAIRSMDVLAYNLQDSVNTQHALGFGLDGSTGNPFFTPLAAVEDAAQLLVVDPTIVANVDRIAAGGASSAPGDNLNAQALADLRNTGFALSLPGDPPGPPSGPTRTLLEHAAVIVTDIGLEAAGLRDAANQHQRVLEVLDNRRDEISGVSIDEEVTNLIQLQAIFQANSRVVNAVDEMLQDLVAIL